MTTNKPSGRLLTAIYRAAEDAGPNTTDTCLALLRDRDALRSIVTELARVHGTDAVMAAAVEGGVLKVNSVNLRDGEPKTWCRP